MDVMRRILETVAVDLDGVQRRLNVNLAVGITDVDDKIIAKAGSQKISVSSVAREYEADFMQMLHQLNV